MAWEHHYGILLPIFALLLAASIGNLARILLLAICYVFISNLFGVANLLAETPLNLAQSYLFVAALVLLLVLHTARRHWRFAGAAGG
jgi:alpha-1,2-mannosyltransferase